MVVAFVTFHSLLVDRFSHFIHFLIPFRLMVQDGNNLPVRYTSLRPT